MVEVDETYVGGNEKNKQRPDTMPAHQPLNAAPAASMAFRLQGGMHPTASSPMCSRFSTRHA